jgi:hypothetical protein
MTRDEETEIRRQMEPCMHCGFEPEPGMRLEERYDFDRPTRRHALLEEVALRSGTERLSDGQRFSSGFVVEQAAHRHFMLLRETQQRLIGTFTQHEFSIMLNVECGPVWQWDTEIPVAQMVADDHGVSKVDGLPAGGELRVLLEKLAGLSSLENAALVDACERVSRGYANPLLVDRAQQPLP